MPPTSCSTERSWSTLGQNHTRIRNRLKNAKVEKVVTVQSNLRYAVPSSMLPKRRGMTRSKSGPLFSGGEGDGRERTEKIDDFSDDDLSDSSDDEICLSDSDGSSAAQESSDDEDWVFESDEDVGLDADPDRGTSPGPPPPSAPPPPPAPTPARQGPSRSTRSSTSGSGSKKR